MFLVGHDTTELNVIIASGTQSSDHIYAYALCMYLILLLLNLYSTIFVGSLFQVHMRDVSLRFHVYVLYGLHMYSTLYLHRKTYE
jgi:hypothetical protein